VISKPSAATPLRVTQMHHHEGSIKRHPVPVYDSSNNFGPPRKRVRRWIPAASATEVASLEVDNGFTAGSVYSAVRNKRVKSTRGPHGPTFDGLQNSLHVAVSSMASKTEGRRPGPRRLRSSGTHPRFRPCRHRPCRLLEPRYRPSRCDCVTAPQRTSVEPSESRRRYNRRWRHASRETRFPCLRDRRVVMLPSGASASTMVTTRTEARDQNSSRNPARSNNAASASRQCEFHVCSISHVSSYALRCVCWSRQPARNTRASCSIA
jgi:hypothetical protein